MYVRLRIVGWIPLPAHDTDPKHCYRHPTLFRLALLLSSGVRISGLMVAGVGVQSVGFLSSGCRAGVGSKNSSRSSLLIS